jgi:RIO-like serine/threonine protein kinase
LDILLEAIVYGIHSLFHLSILHEEFMVVHSDISYNNIMYSSDGDMWESIDFNLAMPLEGPKMFKGAKEHFKPIVVEQFTWPDIPNASNYDV